ncbi:MAG: hypothetical protein KAI72_04575 [Candidatus Pacebacteria bacterium]|nr:hypothetical protein [Candidatus Paceibacterota bacterium]
MKLLLITFDCPPMVSGIGTFFGNVWKLLPQDEHSILAPRFKDSQTFDKENNSNVYRYFAFGG